MSTEQKQNYWLQHFKDWQQSTLPQKEYCQKHNLKLATFGYWRTKLCRKTPLKTKFIPMAVQKPSPWIKVFLPTGIRIEVPVNALPNILPLLTQSDQGAFDAAP